MRRLAWTLSITTGIILVLGLIDFLTNYNWANDQDPFQGNPNILLNDGATVLIAGGFLTIGCVLVWIVTLRRERNDQREQ